MTYTTLTYGGTEKVLADWGVGEEGCILTLASLEMDTLQLRVPGANVGDAAIWPFEGLIVLQTGRVSSSGAPDTFSGGVIEFTGKRLLHVVDGRPDFKGVAYNFGGPWYDIHNTPYQQLSTWWLGAGDSTGQDLSSDVLLFGKNILGVLTWVTTKQQIFDTLQHVLDQYSAQSMAPPFQVVIGNIDVNMPLPLYPMLDVKCSEVLEYCLRPSPDARLWFDYTTTPPTAYVQSRANCTPVAVAIADGVQHESLRITPRYDLQARSVVIFFKQTNTVDGTSWLQKTKQKYGPNGLNSGTDPDGGLRVLVQTVDLQGYSQNNVYGQLTTLAVTNDLSFWSTVVPELRSTRVRNFSVLGAMTVVDDSGSAVSLTTYPNALMDGSSLCSWMVLAGGTPVVGMRVTITVDVSYRQYDVEGTGGSRSATNGNLLWTFPSKRLSWRGILTNGITGNYSAVASAESAQAIPTNLAQLIYGSLAALQYEGDVSIVAAGDVAGGVGMGNTLNLSNGAAAWAAMNAQIQKITKELGIGRTTVTIGPSPFLSAGDLTQLFLVNRYRRIYQNPLTRQTGQASGQGNSVTLGANAVKENTNAGLEAVAFLRTLYQQS